MIPDQNLITSLLKEFVSRGNLAASLLKPYSWSLLATLMTIDLVLIYIFSLIKEENQGYKELLMQAPMYGAYIFMVQQYTVIVNNISNSFIQAGVTAGGGGLNTSDLTNPSQIIVKGYELIGPVLENYIANNGSMKWLILESFGELMAPGLKTALSMLGLAPKTSVTINLLMICVASILIMICFFIIGMQLFVIQVEFAIVAALGIILIPFGVWDKTRFIFDKIKNGIINFGIKMMLITTLTATSIQLLKSLTLPPEPTWQQMFYLLLGAGAMAYLAHCIPKEVDSMAR
jgi:type IV secretion system protein TrbL